MITWGAPIWLYLWLAGMAGGAYFSAFLADRLITEPEVKLVRLATYMGIPLATLGVILLVIDLGEPLRFWRMLTNFNVTSPMSVGSWILMVWVGIAVIMAIAWYIERYLSEPARRILRQTEKVMGWTNFVFSILLMAYTGVLLAASNQPMWAGTILLPSLFVTSAVSTGVAILVFTLLLTLRRWNISAGTVSRLIEADAIVILIELLVLVGYAFWLAGAAMPGTHEAMRILTTGVLAARFWLGVVLLALLIPFWLDVTYWGKHIGERKSVWRAALASSACVLTGAMVLRAVIVMGGQL